MNQMKYLGLRRGYEVYYKNKMYKVFLYENENLKEIHQDNTRALRYGIKLYKNGNLKEFSILNNGVVKDIVCYKKNGKKEYHKNTYPERAPKNPWKFFGDKDIVNIFQEVVSIVNRT